MAAAIPGADHVRKRKNVFLIAVRILKTAGNPDSLALAREGDRVMHHPMILVHFLDERLQAVFILVG